MMPGWPKRERRISARGAITGVIIVPITADTTVRTIDPITGLTTGRMGIIGRTTDIVRTITDPTDTDMAMVRASMDRALVSDFASEISKQNRRSLERLFFFGCSF
jgi:hypothetical protein